jgi:hypothetical protein
MKWSNSVLPAAALGFLALGLTVNTVGVGREGHHRECVGKECSVSRIKAIHVYGTSQCALHCKRVYTGSLRNSLDSNSLSNWVI